MMNRIVAWWKNPMNFWRRFLRWWRGQTLCVKPTGTNSKIESASSGVHPTFNGTYNRQVRHD